MTTIIIIKKMKQRRTKLNTDFQLLSNKLARTPSDCNKGTFNNYITRGGK